MKENKLITAILAGAMILLQASFVPAYAETYDAEVEYPVIIARNGCNEITFKNPQDPDFSYAAIYRVENGTQMYLGSSTLTDRHWKSSGYTDDGLENNKKYTYIVKAVNKSEEESSGITLSAVPRASLTETAVYLGWTQTVSKKYSWAGAVPGAGKDSSVGMVLHTANGSGNFNAEVISAGLDLKENTTYKLSYDIKYDDADTYQSFAVKYDGDWYKDRQNPEIMPENAGEWERKSIEFTTGENISNETIGFSACGYSLNQLVIDNVELNEIKNGVPEDENLIKNGDFETVLPEVKDPEVNGEDEKIILFWDDPQNENAQYVQIFVDGVFKKEVDISAEIAEIDGLANRTEYEIFFRTANDWGIRSDGITMKAKAGRILGRPNVIKDDISNCVVGLDENMEYSTDNGSSWTRYDTNQPPAFDGDISVIIRYVNDGTAIEMEEQRLYFTSENQNDGIVVDRVSRKGNTISVKGHLKTGFSKRITAEMVKDGGNRRNIGDIAAIKQVKSDDDGIFEINLQIADAKKDGITQNGKYNIYLNDENDSLYTLSDIVFADSTARGAAISALHESTNTLSSLFAKESAYYNGFMSIGFNLDELHKNNDAVYNNALDLLEQERASVTEDNAEKIFYKAYIQACANKSKDKDQMYRLLKKYNAETTALAYGNIAMEQLFSDEQFAVWICEYLVSGRETQNLGELNKKFGQAYVIWQINKSNYYSMAGLLKDNEALLGLSGDAWNYYKNLADNSPEQYAASKKIIEKRSRGIFKSPADILNAIPSESDVNEGKKNSGGGGNVGASSPSSSNTGFVPSGGNQGLSLSGIFADIPEGMWARKAIEYLYSRKIVSGMSEENFEPDRNVKREEFVKMLVMASNSYDPNAVCNFTDVESDKWYASYIASAVNAGIVSGIDADNFGTGRLITREEMAVMIMRCIQITGGTENGDGGGFIFSDDSEISSYAKDAVYRAKKYGIISGFEDGSFAPQKNASRAEAAMMIYTYIQKGDF